MLIFTLRKSRASHVLFNRLILRSSFCFVLFLLFFNQEFPGLSPTLKIEVWIESMKPIESPTPQHLKELKFFLTGHKQSIETCCKINWFLLFQASRSLFACYNAICSSFAVEIPKSNFWILKDARIVEESWCWKGVIHSHAQNSNTWTHM